MSYPNSVFLQDTEPIRKANWLGRYLEVERSAAVEINAALEEAERNITRRLEQLGSDNFSTGVRRAQLNLALREVRKTLRETFGSVGDIIRNSNGEAAVAAVDAGLFDERGILKRLFPNAVDRKQYADSLRRTAERNIQATVTRILETQQPLSGRVWKTAALANGQVSRAVNNALARGDSAENLARDVRNLVRPDVPGGVSYAAKRLARTEINNAFHAQSIADAQEHPWINQMRWHLSKVHQDDPGDECEDYAFQGLFPKEHVPKKPHPNCRCFVTPEVQDYESFEAALLQGHYDSYINGVMGGNYAENIDSGTKYEPAAAIQQSNYFDVAKNPTQVGNLLRNKYPELDVINFNGDVMSTGAAKDIARAIDDLMTKYPGNGLSGIVIGPGSEGEFARTIRYPSGGSVIRFNDYWTRNETAFLQDSIFNEESGYHTKGSGENPYYVTILHEFGHVLDNDGGLMARQEVEGIYTDFLQQAIDRGLLPNQTQAEMSTSAADQWTQWYDTASPSRYSLEDELWTPWAIGNRVPNYGEALAEAFADVETNGVNAKPMSKALYDKLIEARQADLYGSKVLDWGTQQTITETGAIEVDMTPTSFDGKSVEFIADTLRNTYGIDVDSDLGFNDVDMDARTARELGNAFLELHKAFPEVDIQRIQNEDFVDDSYAVTYPGPGYSTISLNKKYFSDRGELVAREESDATVKAKEGSVAPGFHPAGAADEPGRAIFTHEFAHGLDNWTVNILGRDDPFVHPFEGDVYKALWNRFQGTTGEEIPEVLSDKDAAAWDAWQRKNMSGYSFTSQPEEVGLSVHIDEALAEAFDDIQRNGYPSAMEGSKAIYEVFMQKYEEAQAELERRRALRKTA